MNSRWHKWQSLCNLSLTWRYHTTTLLSPAPRQSTCQIRLYVIEANISRRSVIIIKVALISLCDCRTHWLISNAFTQMTNNKCYLTGRIHFSSVCQLWVGREAPRNEMYEAWTSSTRGLARHWRTDLLLSNVFNAAVSGDHRFNDVTTSSDNRISIH